MLKNLTILTLSLALFSCGGKTSTEDHDDQNTNADTAVTENMEAEGAEEDVMDPRSYGGEKSEAQKFIEDRSPAAESGLEPMLGSYVGDFGPNMININLYRMESGQAEGYSICAGNFRKITGNYAALDGGKYKFDMEEPGDDQYDGRFEFTLNPATQEVTGKWTPFKDKGNSPKKYTLAKREFKYDPTKGKYPEASQRELNEEELSNLSEEELSEMRNEIYARHGYSFKNKDWRYHFEELSWYMPMGIDIRHKLTDVEVENIEKIYRYESYFEEYYDSYGR